MAKRTVDRGPAVAQAVPAGVAAVNNINITIQDRVGPIAIRGVLQVSNPAANAPTVTVGVRVNGVQVAATVQTLVMVASTRAQITVEHQIDAPVVGDIITLDVVTTAALAAHELIAGASYLIVEAISQDAAMSAGIGAAAA